MKQITNHILMVKPIGFTYNHETATNNHFQNSNNDISSHQIAEKALREFDQLVNQLDKKGVNLIVADPKGNINNPDAVFPNNWFSVHADGKKVLYPMFAKNRRSERVLDIFNDLEKKLSIKFKSTVDLTFYEDQNLFLEGTGSMILDRVNKISYAAISERTSEKILIDFGRQMNYEIISFSSIHKNAAIYHTNVMMCLGDAFSLICLESIESLSEQKKLKESFENTNKQIIEISTGQIDCFAGNMLQVLGKDNQPLIVMSQSAFQSLESNQIKELEKYGELLFSDLSTIENYGGGSARCMMAELFI